jgi:two-component system cell cycle response regulator
METPPARGARLGTVRVNVLAVGADPGEIRDASVEAVDDLLGALARLSDGGIDAVLVTFHLLDGQGLEAVRSIRERAPDVPVIAVAAEEEAQRALDAGASDVVPAEATSDLVARAIRYVTSLQRMEAELHRRQVVDELTGLYNARGFEQLASHHLALSDRSKRPVVLVFVRLDALDELHELDDAEERSRLIAETASVLRDAVRDSDVVARVGADAFCVLLTGDAEGAEALVLSRLVEAVAASNARAGRIAQLSLSVGAAAYDPEQPVSLEELIAEADRRMGERGDTP